jgi:succinate dehydrogenase / fumarate reductase flavoprotein subunit
LASKTKQDDNVTYHSFDVLIVGAGGAGMRAAIEAGGTVKVGVIENVDSEGAATLRDKQPATTGGLELPLLTVRRPNSEITLAASYNGTSSGYESDNRSQIR